MKAWREADQRVAHRLKGQLDSLASEAALRAAADASNPKEDAAALRKLNQRLNDPDLEVKARAALLHMTKRSLSRGWNKYVFRWREMVRKRDAMRK